MEARKLRGEQILKSGGIQKHGPHLWVVPSQSHAGKWVVDYSSGEPTCTCPDYSRRAKMCKHIFAIEILERRLIMKAKKQPRKTYKQNWPAYNAAQVNERDTVLQLLRDLCEGIEMPPYTGRGRPRAPLADVVFAMAMQTYEGKSGRRVGSVIRKCADDGFIDMPVAYNTISEYMRDPEMTPLLRTLIQESAAPLAAVENKVAVDSSGFGTNTFDRWYDEKWGKNKKEKRFVKAHAACGTVTNVCTDLLVNHKGDATQLEALLEQTTKHFRVEEVSADMAYSSKKNHVAILRAGAVPYIPFKKNATAKTGPAIWRKMFFLFSYKREEFMEHYHRRSNVETLFGMVKGKFGKSVSSKNEVAQANEVHLKFLLHNLTVLVRAFYESKIESLDVLAKKAS